MRTYQGVRERVLALSRSDAGEDMDGSWRAYSAASDALGMLTASTVAHAAQVNNRAMATYESARIVIVIAVAGVSLLGAVRYISRHITGPILSLAARMRSLAANDMSVEIDGVKRNDLRQALSNLISNAVKYSPDGGQIHVGATRSGEALVLTVADQGMGAPVQDQDRVFDRAACAGLTTSATPYRRLAAR
ncbi:MAG: ATP-binding protein [Caulobacteraceae bacterium]